MPSRRFHNWRTGIAMLASLFAPVLDGCQKAGDAVHTVVDYVTTPCPLGTKAVVSADTGTPGLKKLVERWCEEKGENAEPVRNGPYSEVYESGTKHEDGAYVHGKRDGAWTRRYGNGRPESIVTYAVGKPLSFQAWHENGQKWEEGYFTDGYKSGKWIRWHPNGQKEFEGSFEKGTLVGTYTLWHDNGRMQEQGVYKNGQRDGLWTKWHLNGQKQSELIYKNGKPDQVYKAWHENGAQFQEATFVDGQPEGKYTVWHDNGNKEEEGTYRNGVLDGPVIAYDKDGKQWMRNDYKGGSVVDDATADSASKQEMNDPLKLVPGH